MDKSPILEAKQKCLDECGIDFSVERILDPMLNSINGSETGDDSQIEDVTDDLDRLNVNDTAQVVDTPSSAVLTEGENDRDLPSTSAAPSPSLPGSLTASPQRSKRRRATTVQSGTFSGLSNEDKHVMVFSTAGKPIYSYYGNEEEVAELMATAEAIMSVVQYQKENLSYLRAGRNVIAFLDRAPLCLLGTSRLAEPPAVLRMQLALVHAQITSLLTASALTAVFKRNPRYDARSLLQGSEPMLNRLIDSFTSNPAALLGAYPSFALSPGVRREVDKTLQTAVQEANALFGLVISRGAVVCIASSQGLRRQPLVQWDILLLLNFLRSSDNFKHGEAFTPFCLPNYNSQGHLHAYIHYIDAATDTVVVLLAAGSAPDFHVISQARQRMQDHLTSIGAIQAIIDAATGQEAGSVPLLLPRQLPIELGGGSLGTSSILHVTYKLTASQQFVMSPFVDLAVVNEMQQDIVVAYSQVRAAMFDRAGERTAGPMQNLRYEARDRFVLVASASSEHELFIVLDALVVKEDAFRICSGVHSLLRRQHGELFH